MQYLLILACLHACRKQPKLMNHVQIQRMMPVSLSNTYGHQAPAKEYKVWALITWRVLTAQVAAKDLSNSELVNPKPIF